MKIRLCHPFFSPPMAFNSSVRMKPSSTSMARVKMKLFSSKSEDEIFEFFTIYTWPSNSNVRIRVSSTFIDKAKVKPFSSKNKDEIFQLPFLLVKNN